MSPKNLQKRVPWKYPILKTVLLKIIKKYVKNENPHRNLFEILSLESHTRVTALKYFSIWNQPRG